jgi:DNA-binding MltR family transcriptional regulator
MAMTAAEPSSSPDLHAASAARTIALQMLEERGRGAVLVGVARVDTALEHLLQAVMTPGDERRDSLFQPDRPLGSLGAKVALARRLGLIDEPVAQAINALRKLRNTFAHSAGSASLADPSPRSRLEEVYAHARQNSLWVPLESALASQPESSQGALDPCLRDYILLITILVAFLEATAQQLSPLEPPVLMSFGGIVKN